MIRCQECDSEIPGADAFCPFCGISLQPVIQTEPEPLIESPVEEFESTIMMAPEDAVKLAAAPELEESGGSTENTDDEQGSNAAITDLPSGNEEEPASEDISTSIDLDEAPVPAILSDLAAIEKTPEPDVLSHKAAEEHKAADVQEDVYDKPDIMPSDIDGIASIDNFEPEPAGSSLPESILNEDDQTEVERSFSIEDPVVGEESVAAPDQDVAQISESANVPVNESSASDIDNLYSAEDAAVSAAIEMPVEELADHDPFKFGATFDSVRIMENQIPDLMDDADTKLTAVNTGNEPDNSLADPRNDSADAAVQSTGSTSVTTGENDTDGRKKAKLKPLQEGIVLNSRYEIVRKVGGGGMGAVYLASDNNLGGVLRAVKEMVQAHIEEEQQEKAINDFKRESMILSSLDHVSIPTIFDYFYDADEGRFYLVMKYISGGDLSSRLRSAPEGKLDEKTVVEWAIQIADVLDYLHSQPSTIVYRDLKPSNIMVDGNSGRVMLIDFGIARSISQKEEKGVTAVGTMGYAPPELFSGNVEPRSDIYSLGSTMFHLLTGADPQSNPLLIFDFQKNPRPRQINPQLSDQMERILMRSVEYNADARFSAAAELKRVLEEHLENLNSGKVTYGVSEAPAAVSLANQSVFCGFCGQRIVATDLFCAFCGSKQPIAQQGVNAEIYSRSGVAARLFVEGTGELSAPTFSLVKDENLVGRRDPMSNIFPEVDLSKYDPQTKVSRRHARIWRNGPSFLVEDLGSSNGTMVDAITKETIRLIPHKPHPLANGDKIRVGDTTLHFVEG